MGGNRKKTARNEAAPPADATGDAESGAADAIDRAVLVVRGPARGFRRGGLAFGQTPVELTGWAADAARTLAILTEPALTCALRLADGSTVPVPAETIATLREQAQR